MMLLLCVTLAVTMTTDRLTGTGHHQHAWYDYRNILYRSSVIGYFHSVNLSLTQLIDVFDITSKLLFIDIFTSSDFYFSLFTKSIA